MLVQGRKHFRFGGAGRGAFPGLQRRNWVSRLDSVVKLPAFPTLHLAKRTADSVSERVNHHEGKGFGDVFF